MFGGLDPSHAKNDAYDLLALVSGVTEDRFVIICIIRRKKRALRTRHVFTQRVRMTGLV